MDIDCIDTVQHAKWHRWNRGIFRALTSTQQFGIRSRGASSDHGNLFGELFSEIAVYQALSRKPLARMSTRQKRHFLACERAGIRALVRKIHKIGNRVWWSRRRDGSGVDVLIAHPAWPRMAPRRTRRVRTSTPDHFSIEPIAAEDCSTRQLPQEG
jgi:hypothetical protein